MRTFFSILLMAGATMAQQAGIRGFSPDDLKAEREWERQVRAIPEAKRIGTYMERMSAEPHHAGSPKSKEVAEYVAGLLKEWGLDVRIEEYEALLPYPTHRELEMVAPVKFHAKLHESAVHEDKDSTDKNQLPTYNAYSASGNVTGQLVYVNYGLPEDYEELAKHGIDVHGMIVIARYGKSWRGTKPKVAQEHGALGCLIYSDPREDGYFQGESFPKGAYRPAAGVQRGSVLDMPVAVGDPLTPGWASEKGGKKLDIKEAKTIMKIPVLPISYEDARPLLENLGGPVVPEGWRGALPLTYHMGAGPAVVRMKTDFDWTNKPLFDVIATIPGSTFPDEWVIFGNHHDAWVNGADDPVSGASSLLEVARSLAALHKQGWQPKRTIKIALWDGEEFGLMGSTEWVEKHADELTAKAVAYFNSDSNGKGALGVGGSPALEVFMKEVLRDVDNPVTKESLLKSAGSSGEKKKDEEFRLGPLGAGSDYVAFFHHVGVASMNTGFSGNSSGVYHSIYDSFYWYTHFSDSDFAFGKALSEVNATAALRMADADVLPFEFGSFAKTVQGYVDELKKLKDASKLDLSEVTGELDKLKPAAAAFDSELSRGGWVSARPSALAPLNIVLYRSERALLNQNGLPGREWYRHEISAPGLYTGYGAKTLPGVREAAEGGRWDEANREAKSVAAALHRFRVQVEQATDLLRAL